MTARLAAGMLVSALIRRTEAAGGHGMVLARGDAAAGAILLAIADRGVTLKLVERTLAMDGGYVLTATGPAALDEPGVLADYIGRRRRGDPDLWVVELDSPEAERIATELIGG
ncbi:MAG TPA: DUF1491 family protein [Sphingomonadaceae bacterium]|nr:DUF1491 family protein [Sphingomonadaceae bacterium]